ncbi:hypothetical protein [Reyranella sp.]|uniref:hypothetical protein n=1 Tax=Reyranella sp. TaxID=1929291 RepID=UPI003783B6AF
MTGRLARHAALRVAAAAGMSTALVASSLAQDVPNLVGIWKGPALAVHIGAIPYRSADRPEPAPPTDLKPDSSVVNRVAWKRVN